MLESILYHYKRQQPQQQEQPCPVSSHEHPRHPYAKQEKETAAAAASEVFSWSPARLRNFIGISGPYNILDSIPLFHARGLDRSVLLRIMNHNIARYSPTDRMRLVSHVHAPLFPASVHLFHGTADRTVQWQSTAAFADCLKAIGVNVHVKYYQGKTHTDPIIEVLRIMRRRIMRIMRRRKMLHEEADVSSFEGSLRNQVDYVV